MQWTDVAKLIAPLAPTLGGVLGGLIPFPGASIAGQALGSVIANTLGVPATPDGVAGYLATTDKDVAIAKLKEAAEVAKAQWSAYAAIEAAVEHGREVQAQQVNETMRAELQVPASEGWFKTYWRPANGWVLVYENAVLGTMLLVALVQAARGSHVLLDVMTNAWPLILAVIGLPAAVVGVAVFSRGQEKIASAFSGAELPTVPAPAPVKPVTAKR